MPNVDKVNAPDVNVAGNVQTGQKVISTGLSMSNGIQNVVSAFSKSFKGTSFHTGYDPAITYLGSVIGIAYDIVTIKKNADATRHKKTKQTFSALSIAANANVIASQTAAFAKPTMVILGAAVSNPFLPIAFILASTQYLVTSIYQHEKARRKMKPENLFEDRIYKMVVTQHQLDALHEKKDAIILKKNGERAKELPDLDLVAQYEAEQKVYEREIAALNLKQARLKTQAMALCRVYDLAKDDVTHGSKAKNAIAKVKDGDQFFTAEDLNNARDNASDEEKNIVSTLENRHRKTMFMQRINIAAATLMLAASVLVLVAAVAPVTSPVLGTIASVLLLTAGFMKGATFLANLYIEGNRMNKAIAAASDSLWNARLRDSEALINDPANFPVWATDDKLKNQYMSFIYRAAEQDGREVDADYMRSQINYLPAEEKKAKKYLEKVHESYAEEAMVAHYSRRKVEGMGRIMSAKLTDEDKVALNGYSQASRRQLLIEAGKAVLKNQMVDEPVAVAAQMAPDAGPR